MRNCRIWFILRKAEPAVTPEPAGDGIRPEFREAMESYEAFFDDYAEFMQAYAESDDTLSMLGEYADFVAKYAELTADFEAIDESELSDAEAMYYAEVSLRISQKLLNAAQ